MKRPSQEMISRLVLTLSGLLLAGFVLENFYIRNARLLGGNWDEGNLWFLLSKASMGLIPNVDFVSGYPGGFEAFVYILSHLFEINFLSIQIAQAILLALYFAAGYWVLSHFLSRTAAAGAAVFVAYAAYGAWVSLSPGSVVQLLSIFLLGLILPKERASRSKVFIIGALAAACLLFKQSGIFILVVAAGLLSLRLLKLAPRIGTGSRFMVLLPFNAPIAGYVLFRFDDASAPFVNQVLLFPWIVMVLFLNTRIFNQPLKDQVLSNTFVLKAMLAHLSPFLIGVFFVFAFFPFYYGEDLVSVFFEIFFRMPALIDRDISSLSMFSEGANFLLSIVLLTVFVFCLEKVLIPSDLIRALSYSMLIALLCWLSVLPDFWVGAPSLLWTTSLFALYWGIKWISEQMNGELSSQIEQTVLFRLVFTVSVILATAWPYPSLEFLAGFFASILFIVLGILTKEKKWGHAASLDRLIGVLLLIFTFGIWQNTSKLTLSFEEKEILIESGILRSATLPFKREQRFIHIAEYLREELPAGARIVGYPNLAFSMVASGFVPVSFQGNYFGDDDGDIKAFIDNITSRNVDCVLINASRWPYAPEFPYFPDPKIIIRALQDDFEIKNEFDLVSLYCKKERKL